MEEMRGPPFFQKMILEVQAMVEKGASKEKIGLRGPMPPGMLFAVYDTVINLVKKRLRFYTNSVILNKKKVLPIERLP
ncbi:MAG: hypothetical protein ACI4QX_09430 [Lachnospiraceae bacterium]